MPALTRAQVQDACQVRPAALLQVNALLLPFAVTERAMEQMTAATARKTAQQV